MRKKSSSMWVFISFLLCTLAVAGYVYTSDLFERESPHIVSSDVIYWNLKEDIKIKLKDNVGIKNYNAQISDGENSITLANEILQTASKEQDIFIKFPRSGFFTKNPRLKLIIEATDGSKWNYLAGNKTQKIIEIVLDNQKPILQILDASYGIAKGGAALVAFEAKDANLEQLYIQTNYGKIFKPTPFYKEGYYVCLVAWPSYESTFSAQIVAIDRASNKSISNIRYYLKARTYRTSKLELKDNFLDGKILELSQSTQAENLSPIERFKFVNETMRKQNEDLISQITSKTDESLIDDFKINPFYPLKNGAAVASYGDHRYFYKDGSLISESYHLGLDLASIKHADITTSNDGVVVFNEQNGIYGLNLILYHNLGLYSLYGHCNSIGFDKGAKVQATQSVATTGMSGLALGDHLHFGILVQGIEVRPEEWMDKEWIELNIYNILNNTKKLINMQNKN